MAADLGHTATTDGGPGASRARVLIYAAAPSDEPGAVEAAYHRISGDLAGTPGLLGNELLRAADDPAAFVVMSEWESLDAFRAWEEGAGHRDTTAPLRRYQRAPGTRPFGIYEVTAAY
ncbi:antibiotic biosynthesis monooxygenase [Microtetraspora sp. NBRC 13810]|uniref:antibiotic biosynthesis monooxygenase family protein n=1 Tax=Microtetraspora sp. NBRC 13810 TaxID=3030990 RepID=UPI0024A26526|nr:antibiotic biosynthesis monooxygenase [Microtetraspora sp. NBRC 13810]GLW06788.1 antibiotic biosynthesis monooxygenase [Microtetraspora sp. NBRC 13810]